MSTIVVGADTGLMHCAGALGKSSLTLFGSTNPKEYLPFGKKSHYIYLNLECAPCFGTLNSVMCEQNKCMRLISVDVVYNKVINLTSPKIRNVFLFFYFSTLNFAFQKSLTKRL